MAVDRNVRRERLLELHDEASADRIMALEDENEVLRQRLEEVTSTVFAIPGVTSKEMIILSTLYRREGIVTKGALHSALYQLDPGEGADEKIIDVFICKLRKKLSEFGIVIETAWGRGYSLTEESRVIIRQYEKEH